MGVNKVIFGAVSIMDITDSTVAPDKLLEGETAYDKTGEKVVGTMKKLTVTDDGNGNVVMSGVAVTDDGGGNVTIGG